jgi:tRNA threonylcarbamoyladenosine biosynthesis protein TsaB
VTPFAFPLLVIEAATAAGSVALLIDEGEREVQSVPMGVTREDGILPAVAALCAAHGIRVAELRGVVCGAGPGSFTSLRIAASIAKGIAHANGAPLYAVPSLLLAAAAIGGPGEYLVHSEAMRGERFVQQLRVDAHGRVHAVGDVARCTMDALHERAAAGGTGAGEHTALRTVAVVASPDAEREFAIVAPDASRVMQVQGWDDAPVDLHAWEPDYGRLAEAQVKWESAHGRPLPLGQSA